MDHSKDIEFEVEWRKLLISRLARVQTTLNKAAEAEQAAAVTRQAEIRELYPTEEEAHEAFGNADITEDEYRAIAAQLQSATAATPTSAARDELRDILSRLRRAIRDLEWETLPDAEKERIRQSGEKFKDRIKAAKDTMGGSQA